MLQLTWDHSCFVHAAHEMQHSVHNSLRQNLIQTLHSIRRRQ